MIEPKLCLIPSAYRANKVYSVLPSDGAGDFDFTRASEATRINKDGLIETVGSNVPRLNYPLIDGVVSGCPSLLLENSATNLIQYSEAFDNAYWIKSGSSVVSGFVSPKGDLSAFKLVEDTGTTSHYLNIGVTMGGVGEYSMSYFVKPNGIRYVVLASNANGGENKQVGFDLVNGTITYNGSGFGISKIEPFANGWFRISAIHYSTSAGALRNFTFNLSDSEVTSNATPIYTGDGTSGVYIYGAQVEQGSYATSYIPTQGSIGTRVTETCSGAGNVNTFNDSEGVLMAEIEGNEDGTSKYITISDGSIQNRITIILLSNNNIYGQIRTANSEVFFRETSGISIEQNNKIAVHYKTNQCKLFVNGFQIGSTDTLAPMPSGLNTLAFDDGSGAGDFYGNTKQIQYFNTALNDSDLETLTSWDSFSDMATSQLYTIE